jgi:hypothetical protein
MTCPSKWNMFYFLGGYTDGPHGGIDAGDGAGARTGQVGVTGRAVADWAIG